MQSALTTVILATLTLAGITTTAADRLSPRMSTAMQSLSQRVGRVNLKPKLACMRGDVLISACGSPGSLYPSCDKDFQDACKVSGGSTNSCGPACQATVNCLDDSDLYHACDEKFIVACGRDMEGTFECTSECDDGTCCAGNCSRPD